MSDKTFKERKTEIKNQMGNEGLKTYEAGGHKDVYEEGFDAIKTSRHGDGTVTLPNKRLAALWDKCFRVQFYDGGWRTEENFQMEHPSSYGDADIEVVPGATPRFEAYETHEKMVPPLEHYQGVEFLLDEMVYIIRLMTGDDDYGRKELEEDLRALENMEFDIASIENCSLCNPEIY